MTVKELMMKLAELDGDMKVVFPDTYEQAEGWDEGSRDAVLQVYGVCVKGKKVILCGEEED